MNMTAIPSFVMINEQTFSVIDVPGDGNCLFHSIVASRNLNCASAEKLRGRLFDFASGENRGLCARIHHQLGVHTENFDVFLAGLAQDRTWRSMVDVSIVTLAFGIDVETVAFTTRGLFVFSAKSYPHQHCGTQEKEPSEDTIRVSSWTAECEGRISLEDIREGMTSIHQVGDIALSKPIKSRLRELYYGHRIDALGDATPGDLFRVRRDRVFGFVEKVYADIKDNRTRRWIADAYDTCGMNPWATNQDRFKAHVDGLNMSAAMLTNLQPFTLD
ncbi:hypothetical protein SDRG_17264 [Saprolegnia diclina VS20]|uniref:OTU domain-containing protein n=1 Tax=Saprolegnia diclina (strain VS20) TaxID=1156394 RepID=T0R5R7_SAPDV|nr:hypothetical protein SDRG_17264 [Saprolegnia diclina VS20]EQC24842.1 hypothetical protein SDRG_17264 [Saprolegnia diclina VS20]|eukprot:XP_008621726.1 hypothetical protein SDRG_17264 [Saprolegnia diclina VS20]